MVRLFGASYPARGGCKVSSSVRDALLGGWLAWTVAGPVTEANPAAGAAMAAGLAMSMIVWGGFVSRPPILRQPRGTR